MKPANSSSPKPSQCLAGQTVLVTRAADQSGDLVRRIEEFGGRAVVQPVIEILPASDLAGLDASIARLEQFEVLVFTSRNGVRFFKERMDMVKASLPEQAGLPGQVNLPEQLEIAAIGSSTADLAQELWEIEPAVPASSHSGSLADFLIDQYPDRSMLLVRGDRGSKVLDQRLGQQKIGFESVVAYRSVDVTKPDSAVVEMFQAGQIDWVTATSSAIGRSAVKLFGEWLVGDSSSQGKIVESPAGKRRAKLVSISPTTSAAIESVGGQVSAEATEYNLDGLVAAMGGVG